MAITRKRLPVQVKGTVRIYAGKKLIAIGETIVRIVKLRKVY
jgi:hypothetical protein